VDFSQDIERPMRALGDRVEEYRDVYLIGNYVLPDRINYVRPDETGSIELGQLGICSAIGSGSRELLAMTRSIESGLPKDLHPADAALSAARIINQRRAYQEMFQKSYSLDWGGFMEHLYYDSKESRWKRQDPTICLYLKSFRDSSGELKYGILDRIICYDPGGDVGRMLYLYDAAELKAIHYQLDDVLLGDKSPPINDEFWRDWSPKKALVTIMTVAKDGSNSHKYLFGSFDVIADSEFAFSFSKRGFELNADAAELRNIIENEKRFIMQNFPGF
jgi:hypothetical protein